jgi:hypothetical protein
MTTHSLPGLQLAQEHHFALSIFCFPSPSVLELTGKSFFVGVFDYLFQQQQQQQQHGSIVAAVVEVVSSGEVAAQVEACDLTLSSASNSADNLVKF